MRSRSASKKKKSKIKRTIVTLVLFLLIIWIATFFASRKASWLISDVKVTSKTIDQRYVEKKVSELSEKKFLGVKKDNLIFFPISKLRETLLEDNLQISDVEIKHSLGVLEVSITEFSPSYISCIIDTKSERAGLAQENEKENKSKKEKRKRIKEEAKDGEVEGGQENTRENKSRQFNKEDYTCYYTNIDDELFARAAQFTPGVFTYLYFDRNRHQEINFDPRLLSENLLSSFQMELDYVYVKGSDVYAYLDSWQRSHVEVDTHLLFDYSELSDNIKKAYQRTELLLLKTNVLERFNKDPLSFEYLDVRFDDRAFVKFKDPDEVADAVVGEGGE